MKFDGPYTNTCTASHQYREMDEVMKCVRCGVTVRNPYHFTNQEEDERAVV